MTAADQVKKPPRYQTISDTLRAELAEGIHRIGECLPTEHDLCRRFTASRYTIRQALDGLRKLGLVEPRSGVGTIVIANEPREQVTQTLSSFEELFQYPSETYRRPLSVKHVTAGPDLAQMLGSPLGQDWTRLHALRVTRSTDTPISWMEAYLLPEVADVLKLPNPAGISLLSQIEDAKAQKAARAEVEMSVKRIDPSIADLLDVDEGAPGFVIVRRYSGTDGRVYLLTYSIHPENRFTLKFDLEKR